MLFFHLLLQEDPTEQEHARVTSTFAGQVVPITSTLQIYSLEELQVPEDRDPAKIMPPSAEIENFCRHEC